MEEKKEDIVPTKMQVIVQTGYGGPEVLQVKEMDVPKVKEDEVLIKIIATSVTAATCSMRTGKPYFGRLFIGLTKPNVPIPGTDLAGVIQEIGKNVKKFAVGDHVIAATDTKCSTYAQYICLNENNDVIVKQPNNMNANESTGMIDGAMTAYSFLNDTIKVSKGQKIVINGASGSIGTAAVQLCKYYEMEVTGICSTKNIDLVKSLGADFVIDYTKEDFTKNKDNFNKYDIVFDTVGKLSISSTKNVLVRNGIFLTPCLTMGVLSSMIWSSMFSNKKVKFAATGLIDMKLKQKNLEIIVDIIEKGKFKTIIDKSYPLNQAKEAQQYVDNGHKVGNVVLTNDAF